MKKFKNWVCHKNKMPIDPKTGNAAKSNDSNTWGTYQQAKECMKRDKSISGLGFMFGNSPYVGIDIDHCIQDGKMNELAQKIIATFQSYTEISPSGTGVHILCKGKLEGGGRKNSNLGLEVYDTGRYFTVTENALESYPNVLECQKEIDALCQEYFSKKEPKNGKKQQQFCYLEDEKLIELAKNSKNGLKFADLYAGNWQNYYKSQSEADIALCNMLAFWTGNDFDQIDRIFRSSGLMREKWNQKHGINTYGDMTITKAVDGCEETFQPSQVRDFNDIKKVETHTGTEQNPKKEVEKEEKKPLDQFHKFNGKGQVIGVFDAKIMKYLIETEHLVVVGDSIYLYQNGVYQMDIKGTQLKNKIQNLIYEEFQNARTINRIYDLILMQSCLRKRYSEMNQYPDFWINFQNGMLNVKTMELLPHAPVYFSMNQIPHDWKEIENKSYPASEHFLNTSVLEQDIITIFEYLGLCMTHSTKYQIFLLLKGEGANGKSILIDIFHAVIGEQNISNLSMSKLTQRFFSSQLCFKLCNTCADISKITIEDDAELKTIIGGDVIQAEFKGKDSFSFRPYAKMLFSANRFPYVDDKSDGFKRRLRVIDMNQKPPGKDVDLTEKILQELDYWVYWAVQNLRIVLERKDVFESQNSKKVRENLHKESDSVYAFINDCLQPQAGMMIKRADMFREYDKYCHYYERVRVKKKTFFEEIAAKGFVAKRKDTEGYVYSNVAFIIWEEEKQDIFKQA